MELDCLTVVIVLGIITLKFHHVLACNGYTTLTNTQGHISSPHYPNYNPQASRCYWLIHVEQGRIITLEFQTFDVGQGTECSVLETRKTYVEVRDGTNNASIGIYCGSEKPISVSSHSNQMLVVYVANGYSSTKFTARYRTTKDSSISTIVLLSLAAMFGTALCIVFTIVLIKRNRGDTDEENSHVTPSRDIASNNGTVSNNGTCALTRIPSLLLLSNMNKGVDDDIITRNNTSTDKRICNHGNVNQFHQCKGTMENCERLSHGSDRCHDSGHYNNGYDSRDNNDAAVVMEGVHPLRQDRLSPPLPETNTRKLSDSESILTTAKVIYVRDSSSSRSSSSSSNEQ